VAAWLKQKAFFHFIDFHPKLKSSFTSRTMALPTALVLAPLPPAIQPLLEQRFHCLHAPSPAALETALAESPHPIRALVGHGSTQVTASLLDQLPHLEIITLCGVGYDGIDLPACRARGIRLTNTPDVLTDDVADIATALVLMTSRRLIEANRFLHQNAWPNGPFPFARALRGKTAGILGLGRIGKAIATRLTALGMTIAYHSRKPQPVPHTYHPTLISLATASDFLILACPGGPDTHHLVDAQILAALGPTGTLINIARGSVVDEPALIHALETNLIHNVGLDVFENEPHLPSALIDHPRAVLLPHVGSATTETRTAMGQLCLDNLNAHFADRPLLTPVL
jgi:lactate dehydrogenase-like 2-hydroxyacid dehydrogenase